MSVDMGPPLISQVVAEETEQELLEDARASQETEKNTEKPSVTLTDDETAVGTDADDKGLQGSDGDGSDTDAGPINSRELVIAASKAQIQGKRQSLLESLLTDDADYDTDLETTEEHMDYHMAGKMAYKQACAMFSAVPVSYFMRHIEEEVVSLAHHGLGPVDAKAIAVSMMHNTRITSLDLSDNCMGAEGGQYISEMVVENCFLDELNLSNNQLGRFGCMPVFDSLEMNTTLKYLQVAGNQLCDRDAEFIAKALEVNNVLNHLDLSHNDFGETTSNTLAHAISENETVENLDLSWNHFRLKSGVILCKGIATNPRLRVVNLSMNGLGNEGSFGVAEILTNIACVTDLNISHNRIGVAGAVIISKALATNEILEVLRIGHNPLGMDGIKQLLVGVDHDTSRIQELDLTGIEVDKEFRDKKEELQKSRDIIIQHGAVLSDYVITGKYRRKITHLFETPIGEITPLNVMALMKRYCDDKDIKLYDALLPYDVNKAKTVTWESLLSALNDVGIELRKGELEILDNMLPEHKLDNGLIDFSSLHHEPQYCMKR